MGIGFKELLIILAIALLIFGAKRLKTIGSDLGGAVKGFKKAMDEGDDKESRQLNSPDQKDADFDSTPVRQDRHQVQRLTSDASTYRFPSRPDVRSRLHRDRPDPGPRAAGAGTRETAWPRREGRPLDRARARDGAPAAHAARARSHHGRDGHARGRSQPATPPPPPPRALSASQRRRRRGIVAAPVPSLDLDTMVSGASSRPLPQRRVRRATRPPMPL